MIGREELFALAERPLSLDGENSPRAIGRRAQGVWLPAGKRSRNLAAERAAERDLFARNYDLEDAVEAAGGRRGSGLALPTPAQQSILDYLRSHSDRLVNRFELRDECAPGASEGVIGVQIHYLRTCCGVAIESKAGPYGGYRLASVA